MIICNPPRHLTASQGASQGYLDKLYPIVTYDCPPANDQPTPDTLPKLVPSCSKCAAFSVYLLTLPVISAGPPVSAGSRGLSCRASFLPH